MLGSSLVGSSSFQQARCPGWGARYGRLSGQYPAWDLAGALEPSMRIIQSRGLFVVSVLQGFLASALGF